MKKFPASVRRMMFWSKQAGGTSTCPRCGELLEPENHTYLMGIWYSAGDSGSTIVGGDGGYFCPGCPTVVLRNKKFEDFASLSADGRISAYTVIGAVDLDAVPEERSHLPFDEDENPIPLVEFLQPPRTSLGKSIARRSAKSRNQRKRERQKR